MVTNEDFHFSAIEGLYQFNLIFQSGDSDERGALVASGQFVASNGIVANLNSGPNSVPIAETIKGGRYRTDPTKPSLSSDPRPPCVNST
jgi:hypothetical protein